jgi:YD repeat-containing protein
LTSETHSVTGAVSYSYDAAGQLTQIAYPGSFNVNQYTLIAGVAPVYDGNGNITTDHKGRSFAYDAENVLRSATGLAAER